MEWIECERNKRIKMTRTNLVRALGKIDAPRIVMSCEVFQRKIEYSFNHQYNLIFLKKPSTLSIS